MEEIDIEKFVAESQKGNAEAFGKIYDNFINPIFRYMHFRVGVHDSEDLTELVFLKTWENIRKYRRGIHGFSAWLFRIAHNVVVDHYRSRHPEDELSEDLEDKRREADAIFKAHQRFDREALEAAMAELKDNYRQVLILKYMNELSNEEICFITGRSHASLRILQFRALRSLRRILERRGISEV